MLLLVRFGHERAPWYLVDPDLPAGRRRAWCSPRCPARRCKTVKLTALAFSLAELVRRRRAVDRLPLRRWAARPTRSPCRSRRCSRSTGSRTFGINFSLGVDGISLTMIALIAVLMPIVLGASWEEKLPAGRTIGGYFALLLVLQGGDGRRLRGHQRLRVLRDVRGHADPDVLPDRGVRRGPPGLRGDQVLPVLAARRPADAGLGDRPVRRVRQRAARRRHVRLGDAALASPARSPSPPRCGSSPGSPSRSRSRRRWCRCTPGCPTPVPRRRSAPARCWSACWTRSAPSASCGSACRCCRPPAPSWPG